MVAAVERDAGARILILLIRTSSGPCDHEKTFTLSNFRIIIRRLITSTMTPPTRKTISVICLVFAILWFVLIGLSEAHYVRSVLRHQTTLHDILGTIYEEQIEGINFVILVVFLIPGVFAWAVYRRFRREY